MLSFWVGGYGPCLAEMPLFEDRYRTHGREVSTGLAVNLGEIKEAVGATVKRIDVPYPAVIDQLETTAKRYGVVAVPTSFIVDRTGVLRGKVLGEARREFLEKEIGAWL